MKSELDSASTVPSMSSRVALINILRPSVDVSFALKTAAVFARIGFLYDNMSIASINGTLKTIMGNTVIETLPVVDTQICRNCRWLLQSHE